MSLIELMVALTLGAFIILGVVNVLMGNKQSSQVERAMASLQQNGRSALDLIVSDIRDAMYFGCHSALSRPTVMANGFTWSGLQGFERAAGGWTPTLPATLNPISAATRIGSDVLNLQHSASVNTTIANPVVPASTAISISDNPECISQNDLVVVSSCVTAHLFRVTNSPACDGSATTLAYTNASNSITSMTPGYGTSDELFQLFDKTWFVADTGRVRTGTSIPEFALYRRVNGVNEEMITGVEHMQITYGQELASGNIRYVSADNASLNMDDVLSVRIALLIQSFEPILETADTDVYQLLDESIDSAGTTVTHNGDTTLRRVFQTTAVLRNTRSKY